MVSSRYLNSNIQITNIKISCALNQSFKKDFNSFNKKRYHISRRSSSFFVIRCIKQSFVLIIFYKGHINITGIRDWQDIGRAYTIVHYFAQRIQAKVLYRKIDNISASFFFNNSVKLKLLLPSFCQFIRDGSYFKTVNLNLDKFAGACLRSDKGTVVLFSTYSCYTVGAKSIHALNALYKYMNIQLLNFQISQTDD